MKVTSNDITIKDYHNYKALSRSGIVEFIKGPNHFKEWLNTPKKQTPAMALGSAFHTLVLEPDKFNNEFIVSDLNLATKAGRELKKSADKEKLTIIKLKEFEKIKRMSEVLLSHPTFGVIKEHAEVEKSFFWEERGVDLQTRPDMICPGLSIVCDIKTTRTLDRRKLAYGVNDFGYDIQAAMAMNAGSAFYQKLFTGFVLVYIEKEPPFDVVLHSLLPEKIMEGERKYQSILEEYKQCLETDTWPSRQPLEITPLDCGLIETEFYHDEFDE